MILVFSAAHAVEPRFYKPDALYPREMLVPNHTRGIGLVTDGAYPPTRCRLETVEVGAVEGDDSGKWFDVWAVPVVPFPEGSHDTVVVAFVGIRGVTPGPIACPSGETGTGPNGPLMVVTTVEVTPNALTSRRVGVDLVTGGKVQVVLPPRTAPTSLLPGAQWLLDLDRDGFSDLFVFEGPTVDALPDSEVEAFTPRASSLWLSSARRAGVAVGRVARMVQAGCL